MASYVSSSEDYLTQSKDLGKYRVTTESRNENARPHDKSRALAAEDVDIIRMCGGCGKHMPKVKSVLVCFCKLAIHCSKDCLKSSKHKCKNIKLVSKEKNDSQEDAELQEKINKFTKAVAACRERYFADRITNRGPSSEKVAWLKKITRGDHRRILKYGEARNPNPTAAYVIGRAYMERQFDRQNVFAIPPAFKEKSAVEMDEIAVKWLKVAAEAGVPEAMFLLFMILVDDGGLRVDRRVSEYWLAQAHATGKMDYLIQILETPRTNDWPEELDFMYKAIMGNKKFLVRQELNLLLMATRFRELKVWNGKTAMGETFYGWGRFVSIMESIGELKNDQSGPSFIDGEKKTLLIIPARLDFSDLAAKREENNLKFRQGAKEKVSPDYQLAKETFIVEGRTSYLISCKHDGVNIEEEFDQIKCDQKISGVRFEVNKFLVDISKSYKRAGKCEPCVREATQRLRAVSMGLFSMSVTPVFGENLYAARYANEDGVIVQDVFTGYSKPYMRQLLQCLMTNPADLHPLAVAEDALLFWPLIWFWGSVYSAVEDTCNKTTLDAVYGCLDANNTFAKSKNASALAAFPDAAAGEWRISALAAFPDTAAGEWRIACGNEDCPKVDHEVKFNLCRGCKVRRYCDEACQKKDWAKHMKFCKAGKKEAK